MSELWLDQSLFNDHLSVRVGQMAGDQEFVGTAAGVLFMNGTFGWPSILGVNVQTPNFPIAAPGRAAVR